MSLRCSDLSLGEIMGLFRQYQNKFRFLRRKQLLFSLDEEPTLGTAKMSTLRGWAFEEKGPVRMQLFFRGECVVDAWCNHPRFDVKRKFPEYDHSLLCGFELSLPTELLSGIGVGELQVRLVGQAGAEEVWQWNPPPHVQKNESSATELKQFFQEHFMPQVTKGNTAALSDLHLVIETTGRYGFLKKTLEKLQALLSESRKNYSITLFLSGEAESDDQERIRNLFPQPLREVVEIKKRSEFVSWNKMPFAESEGTILYLHEDMDLSYLDLGRLIKDFRDLPLISLLMPTLYGQPNGICGPEGVPLSEIHSRARINGMDLPALFSTKTRLPIWVSSVSFLKSISLSGKSENSLLPPPNNTYHFDLRQVVCSHGNLDISYDGEEKRQIELVVSNELEIRSDRVMVGETILLIPADFNTSELKTSTTSQVLQFARKLQREKKHIVFAVDTLAKDSSGESPVSYVGEFPISSLSSILSTIETRKIEAVISTNWSTVRSASVVRFLSGCKVFRFINDLEHLLYREEEREHYQEAVWANRADFIPITNSEIILSKLAEECEGAKDGVVVPLEVDRDIFFPYPVLRKEAILFVVDSERHTDLEFLSSLSFGLKRLQSQLEMTLLVSSEKPLQDERLLTFFSNIHVASSVADRARLYSMHEVVVFIGQKEGASSAFLEVLQCGAVPIRSHGHEEDLLKEESSSENARLFGRYQRQSTVSCAERIYAALEQKSQKEKDFVAFENLSQEEGILSEKLEIAYRTYINRLELLRKKRAQVSIIIPVFCALDATVMCLRSVLRYAPEGAEIIVVNDASDSGTTARLKEICEKEPRLILVNLEKNQGFVQACLSGFQAAALENDIVLLNSDVVLSKDALSLLQDASYSHPQVGVASALSTNSPHLQLDLNVGDSLELAAQKIKEIWSPRYPTVITPEGQFLYIRRWALEKFGFFDPVYNRGFCEESDMCMRMFLHGVDMVCADNALIFHKRSASFGSDARSEFIRQNRPVFDARFKRYYDVVYPVFLKNDPLKEIRELYVEKRFSLTEPVQPYLLDTEKLRYLEQTAIHPLETKDVLGKAEIVFILPGVILGGGSLSVLQHVNELLLRGIEARVISLGDVQIGNYPRLAPVINLTVEELFSLQWSNQKVVATFWTTAYVVHSLRQRFHSLDAYYYVQDYEPWFYSQPEQFLQVKEAEGSYELGLSCVVKTEFLKDLLQKRHEREARLITPGIDHGVFYPGDQDRTWGRPRLSALYRPRTTRRAHRETIQLIRILQTRLPELRVTLFGESLDFPEDLLGAVELKGNLSPEQVAKLYRESDIVLDLSYWQGFGRMGIEGMACGAVPVLSQSGGVLRYARDGENSFVLDARDLNHVAEKVILLAKDRTLRLKMRAEGLHSAREFTEEKAVNDWLKLFGLEERESFSPEVFPQIGSNLQEEKLSGDT